MAIIRMWTKEVTMRGLEIASFTSLSGSDESSARSLINLSVV